jgi:amino acid permease
VYIVPYTYPNLSNKTTTTSPFTIVFTLAGSSTPWLARLFTISHNCSTILGIAASTINTVIFSTVLSSGNHALFAGTRILYSLAKSSQAPKVFAHTNKNGVPWPALLATSSGTALCFATSVIGKGELWLWLQNLVGVSNQVCEPTVDLLLLALIPTSGFLSMNVLELWWPFRWWWIDCVALYRIDQLEV